MRAACAWDCALSAHCEASSVFPFSSASVTCCALLRACSRFDFASKARTPSQHPTATTTNSSSRPANLASRRLRSAGSRLNSLPSSSARRERSTSPSRLRLNGCREKMCTQGVSRARLRSALRGSNRDRTSSGRRTS